MVKKLALALGMAAFVFAGTLAYAGADPALKCKNTKLKETGKKASSILKALGKNISKNPDTKLSANISKADSKFSKGFSKAEAPGACVTNGDSGDIETKVDNFAMDVIAALSPSPSGAFLDATTGALD